MQDTTRQNKYDKTRWDKTRQNRPDKTQQNKTSKTIKKVQTDGTNKQDQNEDTQK